MTADWGEAEHWWSRLGCEGELVEAHTLTAGASGSGVFRVVVDLRRPTARREFVIKVGSDERSRRELNFFRVLASHVPVGVPKLVTGREHDGGSCLLFEAAGAVVQTTHWRDDRWEDLAIQLGELHRDAPLTADVSWLKPIHRVLEPEVKAAAQAWAALGYGPLLADIWSRFDHLNDALRKLPICLRHGDWHLGNILLDPVERFVWIDWQEVGLGYGPEDLALLWQRAEFDGLTPPREAMLAAYARGRGIADDAILRRAVVAAELTLLLLSWPPYLAGAPEPARARLLHRLERLVAAWRE